MIGAPLLVVFFLGVGLYVILDPTGKTGPVGMVFIAVVCLFFVIIGTLAVLDVLGSKLIIEGDRLRFVEINGEEVVLRSQIAGFRLRHQGTGVDLILKGHSRKKKGIPHNVDRFDEIARWLDAEVANLDLQEFQAEEEKVLSFEDLGPTPHERKERLTRIRQLMKKASWVTWAITLWAFVYPSPYVLTMTIAGVIPLIGIFLVVKFPWLFKVDEKEKGGATPSVFSLLIPGWALLIRVIMDYNLVDFNDVWIPAGIVLSALLGVLLWKAEEYRRRPADLVTLLIVLVPYSVGAVVQANCLLDSSKPAKHEVGVIDKRIEKGKSPRRFLTVTPWGPHQGENDIEVAPPTFLAVEPGDSVVIHVKSGFADIPWFFTRAPREPNRDVLDEGD